jgi:hypothetical protein
MDPSNGNQILQLNTGNKVFKHETENIYLMYYQFSGYYAFFRITNYVDNACTP